MSWGWRTVAVEGRLKEAVGQCERAQRMTRESKKEEKFRAKTVEWRDAVTRKFADVVLNFSLIEMMVKVTRCDDLGQDLAMGTRHQGSGRNTVAAPAPTRLSGAPGRQQKCARTRAVTSGPLTKKSWGQ